MKFKKKIQVEYEYNHTHFFKDSKSLVSEQFRMLRTNIDFMSMGEKIRKISVTSPAPGSGKTTVSANLAAAFASQKKRVLLVDADLRKPRVHKFFELANGKGLSTLFMENEMMVEDVIYSCEVENLFIMPCGRIPPNPAEMLSSKRMDQIIQELEEKFDFVIYDTPPITVVADAQIMAEKVDGTIFVLRKDWDKKSNIRKAKKLAEAAQANILGAVFNREESKSDKQNYYTDDRIG